MQENGFKTLELLETIAHAVLDGSVCNVSLNFESSGFDHWTLDLAKLPRHTASMKA